MKFGAFGPSKHREGNRYRDTFFALVISGLWRFYRANKKKLSVIYTLNCFISVTKRLRLKMTDLNDLMGFALTLTIRYEKEVKGGMHIFDSSSAKQIFTQKFESLGFQVEHKIN